MEGRLVPQMGSFEGSDENAGPWGGKRKRNIAKENTQADEKIEQKKSSGGVLLF